MTSNWTYWCEPATPDDAALLSGTISLGAEYRRELAQIENRGRVLARALREHPLELRQYVRQQQNIARNAARARIVERGLHWGTYQAVEEAADCSAKTTNFYEDVDTFFPRGVGSACVHLQPARTLRGADDRWVIVGDRLVRHGSELRKNGEPRPSRHIEIALRIGTTEGAPTWARVHARLHRPLPDGAVVSWVKVRRRRIATKHRWEITFTLANVGAVTTAAARRSNDPTADRCVGVDIGWRKLANGGMRIACWHGSDGRQGELVLAPQILARDDKSDSLRAIRDRNRNEFQARLVEYRRGVLDPTWLEKTSSLHAWKRGARFAGLFYWWCNHRIAGDEMAFSNMQAWIKQDRHLWEWESNNRLRRQNAITDATRKFAVELARHYERIGIEAPFVSKIREKSRQRCQACADLAKRCDACTDAKRLRDLNAQRIQSAAPASTRQAIEVAAQKYGAIAIRIDPAFTTKDCSACGHRREDVEDWSQLDVACSSCGTVEDQDVTAAKNLARHARDAVLDEDGKPLASTTVRVSARKPRARGTRKRVANGALEPAAPTQ